MYCTSDVLKGLFETISYAEEKWLKIIDFIQIQLIENHQF